MLTVQEDRHFQMSAGLSQCQCFDVQEDLITFKRVMDATGDALMRAASAVLAGSAAELGFEGALDDFGQRLCDSMAIFGAAHFHCLSTQEKKTLFLQQVGRQGLWQVCTLVILGCFQQVGSPRQGLLCTTWAAPVRQHGHVSSSHCLSSYEPKMLFCQQADEPLNFSTSVWAARSQAPRIGEPDSRAGGLPTTAWAPRRRGHATKTFFLLFLSLLHLGTACAKAQSDSGAVISIA